MKKRFSPISSKKRIAVFVVACILAAGTALAIYAQISWRQYEARNTANREALVASVDTLLTKEQIAADDLGTLASSLSDVADQDCTVDWAQSWHINVSDSARQSKLGCESLAEASGVGRESTEELKARIDVEQQVSGLIADAMRQVDKLDAGQYEQAAKLWSTLATELRARETSESMKEITASIESAADGVAKAYTGLAEADKAEKRSAYDDAIVELQKSHQQLADTNDVIEKSYAESAQQLIEALRAI